MGVRAIPSIICSSTLSRSVYERSNVRVLDLSKYINHTKWIKEKEAVIDELRRAYELAQQQDEAMQRYIAEIIMQELTEDEIEVSLELSDSSF